MSDMNDMNYCPDALANKKIRSGLRPFSVGAVIFFNFCSFLSFLLIFTVYFPNELVYMLGVARGGVQVEGQARYYFAAEHAVYASLYVVNVVL